MSERGLVGHLFCCFDTTYRVLGEHVPRLTTDAYAIRLYETARAMGEVTLRFRDELDSPRRRSMSAIADVFTVSLEADESGAMALFAMATLVGPRLLVSLRDAREVGSLGEGPLAASEFASATTIREILAIGEVARREEHVGDDAWQYAARGLNDRLEAGGHADSFGPSA